MAGTKTRRKATRKVPTTVAGITSRNPFFPYVEPVLQELVRPTLDRLIEQAEADGRPITSREALLRAYRDLTGSRISMTTFSKWLTHLGYQTRPRSIARLPRISEDVADRVLASREPPPITEPEPSLHPVGELNGEALDGDTWDNRPDLG